MHLFGVQMPVANQFAPQEQNRDLVAVTHAHERIAVHVDHIHGNIARRRQRRKLCLHFLAQTAVGARIQQEPVRRPTQCEGRSLPLDLTECAMNSTV